MSESHFMGSWMYLALAVIVLVLLNLLLVLYLLVRDVAFTRMEHRRKRFTPPINR
jgi:hypothetical protein